MVGCIFLELAPCITFFYTRMVYSVLHTPYYSNSLCLSVGSAYQLPHTNTATYFTPRTYMYAVCTSFCTSVHSEILKYKTLYHAVDNFLDCLTASIPVYNQTFVQVMGRANDDTEAVGHAAPSAAIPLLHQTSLEDNGLPPYTDAVAGSPVARGTASSHARHNSSQLCWPGGITPSTVISSTRGSTRVSLSSTVASDPKLLQFFVESEALRMPNPLVRLIGTHTESRPRYSGTNETTADTKIISNTVRDFDIQVSMADLLVPAWRRTRLAGNLDNVYRGGRLKSVATGYNTTDGFTRHSTPSLQEWCHLFCASSASLKSYGSTPM